MSKERNHRIHLEQTLHSLLLTRPLREITVSDLCSQAGLARKVFYKYYRDREDCFTSLVDQVLRESMVYTARNVPHWQLSLDAAQVIVQFWKDHRSLLDILTANGLESLLIARAVELSMAEDSTPLALLSRPELACDEDILRCYLASHYALILSWHRRGFDTPVEHMARKYLRITAYPMMYTQDSL